MQEKTVKEKELLEEINSLRLSKGDDDKEIMALKAKYQTQAKKQDQERVQFHTQLEDLSKLTKLSLSNLTEERDDANKETKLKSEELVTKSNECDKL